MTITILSLVCGVLAALCLCLWFYAANAAQDAADAMWEAGYYDAEAKRYAELYHDTIKGKAP